MLSHRTLLRSALLSSAVALAAFVPLSGTQAAPSYNLIYNFGGADGNHPQADLRLDSAGNLYGTTYVGGWSGSGTVFKLAPDGTETVLHNFGVGEGSYPYGGVTLVRSTGDLYGTTEQGGTAGYGTAWHLTPDGTLTTLHNFDYTNDGGDVKGRMIRDKLGNFYGVAGLGGAGDYGTVWKLAPDGTFTVLHAFAGGADGGYPVASLTRDSAGNLYGTTTSSSAGGYGTVFEVGADGSGFTTLHSFTNGADGGKPAGALKRDKAGNLYGTAEYGGANGDGTVFKLAPDGTLTTLYAFAGGTDGALPQGNLLKLGKTLYGTTTSGGDAACQCGTVYSLAPDGTETILHSFTGFPTDGSDPSYAGLVKGKDGVLYGVATFGGTANTGVVFSVTKK